MSAFLGGEGGRTREQGIAQGPNPLELHLKFPFTEAPLMLEVGEAPESKRQGCQEWRATAPQPHSSTRTSLSSHPAPAWFFATCFPSTCMNFTVVLGTSKTCASRTTGTKKNPVGNSLAIQRLGLCASTARGTGSIPGRGTKIPHATQHLGP